MLNPTPYGIRVDRAGLGTFGSKRGNRTHTGIDWVTNPGDNILCPWDKATFIRIIYPYADDLSYMGGVYEIKDRGTKYFAIIYYCDVSGSRPGKIFRKGNVLGVSQDVAKRYNKPGKPEMTPHIHVEMFRPFNYLGMTTG